MSTLTSALKVLSTTFPDSTFLSLVLTMAPPLPGLWCWNQMTDHSWPSRLRTMPFLRSLVVAMGVLASLSWSGGAVSSFRACGFPAAARRPVGRRSADDEELAGEVGEHRGCTG